MEFFFPRQRNFFFDDLPIREEQQNQQRRMRQQQKQQQRAANRKDYGGNRILEDQTYYDPLFGNVYPVKKAPSTACDCITCQRERYSREGKRHRQMPAARKQFQWPSFPQKSEIFMERKPNYSTSSDEDSCSDLEEDGTKSPAVNENTEPQVDNKMNNEASTNETDEKLDDHHGRNEKDNSETKSFPELPGDLLPDESEPEDNTHKEEIQRKINLIQEIKKELEQLKLKINQLSGNTKDKEYIYCEEMLTKYLLRLDGILAEGEEAIRHARKKVVNEINETLKNLEERVSTE